MSKALLERRNDLIEEMEGLTAKMETENRAFNDDETKRFDDIKAEIRNIDATIKAQEETRGLEKMTEVKPTQTPEEIRMEAVAKEERAFVDFIRGDQRALTTAGQNGVTIPLSVAKMIVDKVYNLSPILQKVRTFDLAGDLSIPIYDFTTHVPSGYATELGTITAQQGTFTSVVLKNQVIVSLAIISKSLVNRADVSIVPFVVDEIAKALAYFLEKELVAGTGGASKLNGLAQISAGQTTTGATTLVITPQELINLQLKVPQAYQTNSAWLMHPTTYGYLAGLTAGAGNNTLLLGNDLSSGTGLSLLGKPVYLSDNMPVIGVNALEIFYGDFSGLAVKLTKNVSIEVLNERFADQYAIGVLGAVECDSAIIEPQKIVAYKGK